MISERMGIPLARTHVIGNGPNDASMLMLPGIEQGVLIGATPEEIGLIEGNYRLLTDPHALGLYLQALVRLSLLNK